MRLQIKKYLLMLLGLLFVVLGVIGAVLPLLPTTPFLLLALACFAKISPQWHNSLLNNRWFGPALGQWQTDRSITRASKVKAMILVALSFAVSIGMLMGRLYLQIGLVLMGSILLTCIWRFKEAEAIGPLEIDKGS